MRGALAARADAKATRLQAAGLNARYLIGGIDGWQSAGRPLVDKAAGPTP